MPGSKIKRDGPRRASCASSDPTAPVSSPPPVRARRTRIESVAAGRSGQNAASSKAKATSTRPLSGSPRDIADERGACRGDRGGSPFFAATLPAPRFSALVRLTALRPQPVGLPRNRGGDRAAAVTSKARHSPMSRPAASPVDCEQTLVAGEIERQRLRSAGRTTASPRLSKTPSLGARRRRHELGRTLKPRGSRRLSCASATCNSLRRQATGPQRRKGGSSPNPRSCVTLTQVFHGLQAGKVSWNALSCA